MKDIIGGMSDECLLAINQLTQELNYRFPIKLEIKSQQSVGSNEINITLNENDFKILTQELIRREKSNIFFYMLNRLKIIEENEQNTMQDIINRYDCRLIEEENKSTIFLLVNINNNYFKINIEGETTKTLLDWIENIENTMLNFKKLFLSNLRDDELFEIGTRLATMGKGDCPPYKYFPKTHPDTYQQNMKITFNRYEDLPYIRDEIEKRKLEKIKAHLQITKKNELTALNELNQHSNIYIRKKTTDGSGVVIAAFLGHSYLIKTCHELLNIYIIFKRIREVLKKTNVIELLKLTRTKNQFGKQLTYCILGKQIPLSTHPKVLTKTVKTVDIKTKAGFMVAYHPLYDNPNIDEEHRYRIHFTLRLRQIISTQVSISFYQRIFHRQRKIADMSLAQKEIFFYSRSLPDVEGKKYLEEILTKLEENSTDSVKFHDSISELMVLFDIDTNLYNHCNNELSRLTRKEVKKKPPQIPQLLFTKTWAFSNLTTYLEEPTEEKKIYPLTA